MTLLFNFGLMSLLILAAQILRGRVSLLQRYHVPSAIIAGFLSLLAGPGLLNWIPFAEPQQLADYPRFLVVVVFATLFPGLQLRQRPVRSMVHQVGDTFFYSLATQFGQYGVALLFGVCVLTPLFQTLNPAFALMMPSGFAGGPGVATATAQVLQRKGWDDALSVGLTFATVGQLIGIIGGMVVVNFGMRRGWTRFVHQQESLSNGMTTGFVPPEEQSPIGRETVHSFVLDALTWHFAVVLSAVALGYAMGQILKSIWPAFDFPTFALAMLAGVLVQVVLERFHLESSVDRATINRIGSVASDYLVAFGICAIRPHVIGAYIVPLVVMALLGVAYSLAVFWFVGRHIYRDHWFERGLFTWGWNTGLVGTGVALLRVVDPKQRSGTLEDYGLAYLFIASLDVAMIVLLPAIVGAGSVLLPALVLIGLSIGLTLLSVRLVGWFPRPVQELRTTDPAWNSEPLATANAPAPSSPSPFLR